MSWIRYNWEDLRGLAGCVEILIFEIGKIINPK